ncbi:hypothetical protein ACJX0J_037427, partial [Zea mays]
IIDDEQRIYHIVGYEPCQIVNHNQLTIFLLNCIGLDATIIQIKFKIHNKYYKMEQQQMKDNHHAEKISEFTIPYLVVDNLKIFIETLSNIAILYVKSHPLIFLIPPLHA